MASICKHSYRRSGRVDPERVNVSRKGQARTTLAAQVTAVARAMATATTPLTLKELAAGLKGKSP